MVLKKKTYPQWNVQFIIMRLYLHHKYPSICLSIITPFYGFKPPKFHTSQHVGKLLWTLGLPIWHTLSHDPPNTSQLGLLSSQMNFPKKSWHTPLLLSKMIQIPQSATLFGCFQLLKTITFSEIKTPPGGIDQQRNNFEECPVETNSLDVMKFQCEIQTWIASSSEFPLKKESSR